MSSQMTLEQVEQQIAYLPPHEQLKLINRAAVQLFRESMSQKRPLILF